MSEAVTATAGSHAASSVGARLRAAREAAHLEPQEIARQLNLDVIKVIALEAGDFAALPPPLYVKGYIRAISRLLGTDAAELLDAYDRERAHVEDPKLVGFSSGPAIQLTSGSLRMRLITAGIVVTLIVLVGIWWRTNIFEPLLPRTPEPSGTGAVAPRANADWREAADRSVEESIPLRDPADGTDPGPILPGPELVPESNPEIAPLPAVVPQDVTATTAAQAPAASPEVVTASPVVAAEAPAAAVPGTVTLILSEKVWISIADARGERLYYDTAQAGQTITVKGQAPYQVVIGNTQGVKLFYGKESIDVTGYERQGVARLVLGAASAISEE
jgi:cytoskeleton protein RodZ